MRALIKPARVALLTMLAYFFQACTVPYLQVGGGAPNVCFIAIAMLSVSYGRLYAFVAGATIGILMELMMGSVNLMFLALYPVLAIAWSMAFADWSDRRREMRRVEGKPLKQMHPFTRILLSVGCMTASYEIVMIAVIYLNGIDIMGGHILRLLISVLYSLAVAILLYWPTRKFLGMYARKAFVRAKGGITE